MEVASGSSAPVSMIFVCQSCGKGFKTEENLAEHNIAFHLANANSCMEISSIQGKGSSFHFSQFVYLARRIFMLFEQGHSQKL